MPTVTNDHDTPPQSRQHEMKRPSKRATRWAIAALVGIGVLAAAKRALFRDAAAVDHLEQAARRELAVGKTAKARALLDRWISASPRAADARLLSAEVALAEGDLAKVTQDLNDARSLGCAKDKLDRVHALSLSRIGRYGEAEPLLLNFYRPETEPDAAVDEALARIAMMTYRLRDAKQFIHQWIKDAPNDGRPFLWLVEYDRRMEVDNSEALEEHYREALKRDPDLDQARLGLAETLRKIHRLADAATEYDLYLARHPGDVDALAGAGRVALELADPAKAALLLDKAVALAPRNVEALKGKTNLELLRGQPQKALAHLNTVLDIDPYDTEAYYLRSRVRIQLGQNVAARQDLEAFKRYEADQTDLLKLRGILMAEPNNNDVRSKVAAWMFAHGREEDGLGWARAVLSSDPRHIATNSLLAAYYDRRGGNAGLANFYRLQASAGEPR